MWLTTAKIQIKKQQGKQPDYLDINKLYQAFPYLNNLFPNSYTGPCDETGSGNLSNISPDPENNIYAKN